MLLCCLPAMARPSHGGKPPTHGGNCVAYARDLTGIRIDGNAATWWPHAEGRYQRGHQPAMGAILVFKSRAGMRAGHVAVVSKIVGPREVLLDHANWVRGRITTAMSAIDASPKNDWTVVRVMELRSHTHGRDNATYGFIYPSSLAAGFETALAPAEPAPPPVRHAARGSARHAHRDLARAPAHGADSANADRTSAAPEYRAARRHGRAAADQVATAAY